MAQRTKYRYRGQTYTRKSQRPGKQSVWVKGHCRSKPGASRRGSGKSHRGEDMPF